MSDNEKVSIRDRIDRRLHPFREHMFSIMDTLNLCLKQQERILKEHEEICKDVSIVMGAHNQLHIFQRQTIQAMSDELAVFKNVRIGEMGDDVNVM